jgi:carbon storage regulator
MLTLSRKPGQALRIGPSVRLIVISVTGKEVRIGIEAPREVVVWREEMANAPPPRVAAPRDSVSASDLEMLATLARRLEAEAEQRSAAGDRISAERDLTTVAQLRRLRQTLASAPPAPEDARVPPIHDSGSGPPRPPRS